MPDAALNYKIIKCAYIGVYILYWISLPENNLTRENSDQLGLLTSLTYLDLSHNALTGSIPENLPDAKNLQVVLLDHNRLSGEIPSLFSILPNLTDFIVSFNNLSAHIPHFEHANDCIALLGINFQVHALTLTLTQQPQHPHLTLTHHPHLAITLLPSLGFHELNYNVVRATGKRVPCL